MCPEVSQEETDFTCCLGSALGRQCPLHRRPASSRPLLLFQDLEHHLGLALNEVQAAKKTWFNRTLSSIKTGVITVLL